MPILTQIPISIERNRTKDIEVHLTFVKLHLTEVTLSDVLEFYEDNDPTIYRIDDDVPDGQIHVVCEIKLTIKGKVVTAFPIVYEYILSRAENGLFLVPLEVIKQYSSLEDWFLLDKFLPFNPYRKN